MKKTITILSLGAGVQSTALALMAEKGLVEMPVAAVFADTGDEPEHVYKHVERLRGMVSFPIHEVKYGNGLGNDFLAALRGETTRASQPPFYVKAPELPHEKIAEVLAQPEPRLSDFNGNSDDFNHAWNQWNTIRRKALNQDQGGMLWRKCTRDYKIVPIRRKVRSIMQEMGATSIRQQIGISTDERQRERVSDVKYITNVYPLLEMGWSRHRCQQWLMDNFQLNTPKSACTYCPYRSNAGWKWMKENDPESFERACQFDEAIRESQGARVNGAGIVGQLYVWRGFAPLRTAQFETAPGQMDFGFEQECEGMCGH